MSRSSTAHDATLRKPHPSGELHRTPFVATSLGPTPLGAPTGAHPSILVGIRRNVRHRRFDRRVALLKSCNDLHTDVAVGSRSLTEEYT